MMRSAAGPDKDPNIIGARPSSGEHEDTQCIVQETSSSDIEQWLDTKRSQKETTQSLNKKKTLNHQDCEYPLEQIIMA